MQADGTMTMEASTVEDNTATESGGGAYLDLDGPTAASLTSAGSSWDNTPEDLAWPEGSTAAPGTDFSCTGAGC